MQKRKKLKNQQQNQSQTTDKRINMIYLILLATLTAFNVALIWKITGLIQDEMETMDILEVKMRDMAIIVKDFKENIKPEMDAYLKKAALKGKDIKNMGICDKTVDFVTTTGKPK